MKRTVFGVLLWASALAAQPAYDLVLKGGHVIDPKNNLSRVLDVAVAGGKIVLIAPNIAPGQAKVADLSGLYVMPGLVDIHVHVYAGTGMKGVLTGDSSVYPDGFSFRTGVTTMVDAGSSGWRNFPDFRQRVIERAKTRVLAMINISGGGMGPGGENRPDDIDAGQAAAMAKQNADLVVGIKCAHYGGAGWAPFDNAVKAGEAAGVPVMIDFGTLNNERNLETLLLEKLRPGDIYTHCYSGHRRELLEDGTPNPAMLAARKRGVLFDLGHGGASFYWWVAVPFFERGFFPDTISTDLHTGSMNGGAKDLLNVMSKVLNNGATLEQVIAMATSKAAQAIHRPQLGNLDVGAEADITVLRLERGEFGFPDSAGGVQTGTERLSPEVTIRRGAVVWDLNGRTGQDWRKFPYKKRSSR